MIKYEKKKPPLYNINTRNATSRLPAPAQDSLSHPKSPMKQILIIISCSLAIDNTKMYLAATLGDTSVDTF